MVTEIRTTKALLAIWRMSGCGKSYEMSSILGREESCRSIWGGMSVCGRWSVSQGKKNPPPPHDENKLLWYRELGCGVRLRRLARTPLHGRPITSRLIEKSGGVLGVTGLKIPGLSVAVCVRVLCLVSARCWRALGEDGKRVSERKANANVTLELSPSQAHTCMTFWTFLCYFIYDGRMYVLLYFVKGMVGAIDVGAL